MFKSQNFEIQPYTFYTKRLFLLKLHTNVQISLNTQVIVVLSNLLIGCLNLFGRL